MEKYAVIGWPIKHSLSPQMQTAGFKALGLDASYEKIAVSPDRLAVEVDRLRGGFSGWNITIPHKAAIIPYLDGLEDTAFRIGSVNTVINRNGFLEGHSTDGYGLAAAILECFDIEIEGSRFVFIGAGGAARASAIYFALAGAAAISIINRTAAKAEAITRSINDVAPHCEAQSCTPMQTGKIKELLETTSAVIQATSLGMTENDPAPLDISMLPGRVPVYDMIYRKTPFLRAAQKRGCPVADGAGMLLYQGARSLELWTSRPPPIEAMRKALNKALAKR